MLICHIGLRGARRTITSDIAEPALAIDALGSGSVIFAAIVDDPANVNAVYDAYFGDPIREMASASATFTAGLAYASAITEAAHALDSVNATRVLATATIAEAAGASDVPDGQLGGASLRAIVETLTAIDTLDAAVISAARERLLSAARPGFGSGVVRDSGNTQIISDIGAVS